MNVQSVTLSLSTTSSMNVQSVCLCKFYTASSVDVIPLHISSVVVQVYPFPTL
jgi:hypothetical protein